MTAANPRFVAADLLAQAEHDTHRASHPRDTFAASHRARRQRNRQSAAVVEPPRHRQAIPERQPLHPGRATSTPRWPCRMSMHPSTSSSRRASRARCWRQVSSAGSVFLGEWSPESMGDYCSGTNHVLPTFGYARSYSGVSLLDFQKAHHGAGAQRTGLRALGPTAVTLSDHGRSRCARQRRRGATRGTGRGRRAHE